MVRKIENIGMGPHYYQAMDEKSKLQIEVDLKDAAEKIEDMNYGTHRFLSHLLDIREARLAEKIARYRERGDDDVAEYATKAGDPLAAGIRKLLEEGCY